MLVLLWLYCWKVNGGSPRAREDAEWLRAFAIITIVLFVCLHALAYFPTFLFGSCTDLLNSARGNISHAYANWRDYHYCAAILVFIVVMYPIIWFWALIIDGIDPYQDLSAEDLKKEGGLNAKLMYYFRVIFHVFCIALVIYVFVMSVILFLARSW